MGDEMGALKNGTKTAGKKTHAKAAQQRVVEPEHLFFKAPREKHFVTGSEAGMEAIRRANVDIAIAYPITPQSETMSRIGNLYAQGYLKDYYRGEDEFGVMSAIAGASRAGVRCMTATSGPGLMRGMEVVASWPGGRLPLVLLLMCRVVNAPLSIQPDTMEIGYMLNTGCLLFHAENHQDYFDFILKAFIISEKCEVNLPIVVAVDGFFVTHARGWVKLPPEDMKLPPRDCYHESVPMMDNENPPARVSRDAPIQKSNFISYQMHASWQQEVGAARERSRRWIELYMGGLIEAINPGADIMIIASGSAASQSREAIRKAEEQGRKVGLLKIKSLRPFPTVELQRACRHVKRIIIPEFNYSGWLNREVRTALYGHTNTEILDGPRTFGGISMPTELILKWLFSDSNDL